MSVSRNVFVTLSLLLTLSIGLPKVSTTTILNVKFIKFWNSEGTLEDGSPCDMSMMGTCDTRVKICFPSTGFECTETKVYKDSNDVTFGNHMNELVTNPLEVKIKNWQGSVRLLVDVYDDDLLGSDDKIVHLEHNLEVFQPSTDGRQVTQRYTLGERTNSKHLEIEYSVSCLPNYYGPRCSMYCLSKDTPEDGHYTCQIPQGHKICRPGWRDPYDDCRTPDHCAESRCENGGRCVELGDGYKCDCPSGYTGVYCEVHEVIDPCTPNPCPRGTICAAVNHDHLCLCPNGQQGPPCHTQDPCDPNPCLTNGTCEVRGQTVECHCLPGHNGIFCEVEDPCSPDPCPTGNVCAAVGGNHICLCPNGQPGHLCDTQDPCDPNPCLNNGTCEVRGQTVKCHCLPGHNGDFCENDRTGDISNDYPIWTTWYSYMIYVLVAVVGTVTIIMMIIWCIKKKRSRDELHTVLDISTMETNEHENDYEDLPSKHDDFNEKQPGNTNKGFYEKF